MTRQQLIELIRHRQSYLCVGLDTDISKIPVRLLATPDPIFAFNKAIIDATQDLCVSYKINTAFYEALGAKGWESMEKTVRYIGNAHLIIADAKRGDIGNTSAQYAKAFFETIPFDAITVAPYMGEDSVSPFLQHKNKWAIVLGLTSNSGAQDFELQMMVDWDSGIVRADPKQGDSRMVRGDTNQGDRNSGIVRGDTKQGDSGMVRGDTNQGDTSHGDTKHGHTEKLYEKVLRTASTWGNVGNLMFVVGATQADEFTNVRKLLPDHFLLVPGVGAQGGSLREISERAMNKDIGLLVNVSRAIIYASSTDNFADTARQVAHQYQAEMKQYLSAW